MRHLENCNKNLLHKIVKTSFQQRRKTLRNSLKSFKIPKSITEDSIFDHAEDYLKDIL